MTQGYDEVKFDGVAYTIKEHNGYRFSEEKLSFVLMDNDDKYVNQEAEELDNSIAYYFEPNVFHALTPEELYEEYNLHS